MTARRPGQSRRRTVSLTPPVVVLALAGCWVGGCNIVDPESRQLMADQESILAPIFQSTTPRDAAAWATDPYDADKRARGTTLLANAPFGGADVYLDLYREHLDDVSPNVRAIGVRGLGLHGDPDDVPRMVPLLSDSNEGVRLEAARSLQRVHNPAAVPPLLERLKPDAEASNDVRAEAATALAQYPEQRVLQGLIGALADDSLLVTRAALGSLRTLTGNDELSDDRAAWVKWAGENATPFAARRAFVYPVYERDRQWLDYLPFRPPVPNELAATPVGMPPVGEGE